MVTGGGGSNDTVGPTPAAKRRRRKDLQRQLDEDDSSELSDESDEDDEPATAARQLKFTKMPSRQRSGSSPLQEARLKPDGPAVMVTSPSRPAGDGPLRQDSTSTIRGRPRRDTTTSSDLSSENEVDGNLFRKRTIRGQRSATAERLQELRIQEEEQEGIDPDQGEDIAGEDSDDSDLASEFSGTADSTSILGAIGDDMTSPLEPRLPQFPSNSGTPGRSLGRSPKKQKSQPTIPQALPPPRPISIIQPTSLLSMQLKVKNTSPKSPFERFATLSGKGDPNPLCIKLYIPHSESQMFELLVRRSGDGSNPVVVADAIGLALYQYGQEKFDPPIDDSKMNVNCWNFRMVEDEEVEYDFPPITRSKPLNDFTSNNNRPQRGRSREKPWDEFALVPATDRELQDNEKQTPKYSEEAKAAQEASQADSAPASIPIKPQHPAPSSTPAPRNPIMGPAFTTTTSSRRQLENLADAPAGPQTHAVPRSGPSKKIVVRYDDENLVQRTITLEATTDTYIAEVFNQACRKLNVDRGLYILRVAGSSTIAPTDRTIEALGDRNDLVLTRRRFIGTLANGVGSPASGSPNAPLVIAAGGGGAIKKSGGKAPKQVIIGPSHLNPMVRRDDALLSVTASNKRYQVLRKQPMSFASSSSRVIALDSEYMHIMPDNQPAGAGGPGHAPVAGAGSSKTTTIHYSSIVHCKTYRKHPRHFKVIVFREKESKVYEFEEVVRGEAPEIVREIKKGMERFQERV